MKSQTLTQETSPIDLDTSASDIKIVDMKGQRHERSMPAFGENS